MARPRLALAAGFLKGRLATSKRVVAGGSRDIPLPAGRLRPEAGGQGRQPASGRVEEG